MVTCNRCLVFVNVVVVTIMIVLLMDEMFVVPVISVFMRMLYFLIAVFENTAECKPDWHKDQEHHAHERDRYLIH